MDKKIIGRVQLGKQGVTDNFISTLESHFKNCKNIKINVLKGAGRKDIKKYSEKILEKLGKHYTARVIGFTIVLKKWRKSVSRKTKV